MADDRPLTSEEMIRRAREDLVQASKIPRPGTEEAAEDLEPDHEPDSDDPEPLARARTQRPRRTLKKSRPPLPADPFSGSSRPRRQRSQQTNPPAVAIIIAVAVAVLGIAVLLAAVAANAP